MSDSTDSTSCNREPFLSDGECDRGNVDIHQFDDLPYCETIDPTAPEIPPEIIDTPLNVPIPPACSCIKIAQSAYIGYGKKFDTYTKFKANGDCCDGNYDSEIGFDIPCPIPFRGDRKITASISYSDSPLPKQEGVFAKGEFCGVNAYDVNLPLSIGCPIETESADITVGIGYGRGPSVHNEKYIDNKTGVDCSFRALSPNFNLQIPCPVVGRSNGRIGVGIKYGNGPSYRSADIIKPNPDACSIEAFDADFNLNIPCPITRPGSIKLEASYISVDSLLAKVDDTVDWIKDIEKWLYENQRQVWSDYNFPIRRIKLAIQQAEAIKSLFSCKCDDADCIKEAKKAVNKAIEAIRNSYMVTPFIGDAPYIGKEMFSRIVNIILLLQKLLSIYDGKEEVKGEPVEGQLWGASEDKCGIEPYNPELVLTLKCPVERVCNKDTKVQFNFKHYTKPPEEPETVDLVSMDSGSCSIKPAEKIDFNIPCPITSSGKVSIGATLVTLCKYGDVARRIIEQLVFYVNWLEKKNKDPEWKTVWSSIWKRAKSILTVCQRLPGILEALCGKCDCEDKACPDRKIAAVNAILSQINAALVASGVCQMAYAEPASGEWPKYTLVLRRICSLVHILIELARSALDAYLNDGKISSLPQVDASMWEPGDEGCGGVDPVDVSASAAGMDIPVPCPIAKSKICDKKTKMVLKYNKDLEDPEEIDLVDLDDNECTIRPMKEVKLSLPCQEIEITKEVETNGDEGKLEIEKDLRKDCNNTFNLKVTFPASTEIVTNCSSGPICGYQFLGDKLQVRHGYYEKKFVWGENHEHIKRWTFRCDCEWETVFTTTPICGD